MKSLNTIAFYIFIIGLLAFESTLYSQTKESKPADDSQCGEQLMETMSALAGTNLFQVYLAITIMNDNVDNTENYEIFDGVLFTLNKQLQSLSEHLTKFNKSKYLTKEDFEYIFQLKDIIFLLEEDIRLFRIFLGKEDDESYKEFFLNHNKVYKMIDDVMELEDIEENGEE
ncbi:hypothetical protein ACFLSQ_03025 [Bacteroidota bacterium]